MSGGGKGGSQTTRVEIPEYLEGPIKQNIARAQDISNIGFVPYFGPDVAAMTPMQNAAMGNVNQAANAMGLLTGVGGMPQAQDYGGVQAYSAGPMYNQALATLEAQRPGQYGAIQNQFLDPFAPFVTAQPITPVQPVAAPMQNEFRDDGPLDENRNAIGGGGFNTTGGGSPGFGGLY